jgi:putative tryptophan/tyrosine transport system substrate-binding protein
MLEKDDMARRSDHATSVRPRIARHEMSRISRRGFVCGSLVLAGASLLAGCAPARFPWHASPGIPGIGVVNAATADFYVPLLAAFRKGLQAHGYEEGRNVTIEERYLDGQRERAPAVVHELLQLGVAAIVTGDPDTVKAAQRASTTVPIIMAGVAIDPAIAGGIATQSRPGSTTTGLSLVAPTLPRLQLEALHDAVPDAGQLRVILDTTTGPAATASLERQVTDGGRTLGIDVRPVHVKGQNDLEPAIVSMSRAGTGGVVIPATPLTASSIDRILDLVLQHRLPALYALPQIARGGGLMALGTDRADLYRRAAGYVDRVLKGARPADLPVEQPERLEFIVNVQTAQAIGLTIPQSVLQRATEIVQ